MPRKRRQDKQDKRQEEKKDPREMQAREAFAAGSYKEALDIYTKLYAEKLHPTYLRNIGRCYQNLQESDRAISSFREYLRKAKDMPADERAEVEGYIKEMEDLQKQNAEAAKPVPQPLPVAAPPVTLRSRSRRCTCSSRRRRPSRRRSTSGLGSGAWWLVSWLPEPSLGLAAGGVFKAKSNNGCPAGYVCPPHVASVKKLREETP
jgi:hypothetical protein